MLLLALLAIAAASPAEVLASEPPGSVVTPFPHLSAAATRVVKDRGGRLVVGGTAFPAPATSEIAVARYTKNGRLDGSFGRHGRAIVRLKKSARLDDIAVAANGKIDIAAEIRAPGGSEAVSSHDFAIVQLTKRGHLDPSFGRHGRTITGFGGNDHPARMKIQRNGRILVAGTSDRSQHRPFPFNARFVLARYLPDGRLDHSFGGDGRVITDFGHFDQASDLFLKGSTIAVTGVQVRDGEAKTNPIVIAHYHLDGSRVRRFGHNGHRLLPFLPDRLPSGYNSFSSDLDVLSFDNRGRVISAGADIFAISRPQPVRVRTGVNRFTSAGKADPSFAGDGRARLPYAFFLDPLCALAGPHGSIYLGGDDDKTATNLMISKVGRNGAAAAGFGSGGRTITNLGSSSLDQINEMIGRPGGKIVAVGQSKLDGVQRFVLARYLPNGHLDAGFGS